MPDTARKTEEPSHGSLTEAELLRSLEEQFCDEFNRREGFGRYSPVKVIEYVKTYSDRIDHVSGLTGVNKAMIAAVMFREMMCFSPDDLLDPLKARLRGDASMGIGQIFISTARRAETAFLGSDPGYSKSDMIKRLMDPAANIYYIGLVLKMHNDEQGLDAGAISSSVLAAYNGSGSAAKNYGARAVNYAYMFERYFTVPLLPSVRS
jgi:hypothetical protein